GSGGGEKRTKGRGGGAKPVDVTGGGGRGSEPTPPIKIMEDVPCEKLPDALAALAQHGAFKAMRQQLRKIPQADGVEKPSDEKAYAAPAIRAQDIDEGSAKLVRVQGEEIAVFKHHGGLLALENACPHEGGQLSAGWIEGEDAVCPLHGYKFNLKTGACATDRKLKARVFGLVAEGGDFKIDFESTKERK